MAAVGVFKEKRMSQEVDMVTLGFLVGQYQKAKNAEAVAKEARIGAELAVAGLIDGPDSGQRSVRLPDGRAVVVKRGLNYGVNVNDMEVAIEQVELRRGTKIPSPIKAATSYKLDVAGYDWYRANDREVYEAISDHVIITPAKVAVSIGEAKK